MATGASDGMFMRNVYDGCIGGGDWEVVRRPYHKNCGCALHKSQGSCSHVDGRRKKVSYPIRRSWSEGTLALSAAAAAAGPHQAGSPSSSPAAGNAQLRRSRIGSMDFEKEGCFGEN
ncbi:hypothetical protein MLD38_006776 [Melastoma candidum]|uniref:Uncharacterized protein n=1 Tax=Melastoma candidum TaxID=119954 RepID=A0ACB9RQA4_9MYRT|nr:hypothetical protein MLD38_006776 [Melastoma candidum]